MEPASLLTHNRPCHLAASLQGPPLLPTLKHTLLFSGLDGELLSSISKLLPTQCTIPGPALLPPCV